MIKALIIDDEKDARYVLHTLIEQCFDKVKVIAEADGIETGVDAIKKYQPDVVFLDIQMRTGTGFDLLQQLEDINFEVIFVTAYNQYAVDAFKFSAFGYLLKPIRSKELRSVIDKLDKYISERKKDASKRLKILIENYGNKGEVQKLIIANVEGFQVVEIKDIIRLEGDSNYTHFVIKGGQKITSSKNIGAYEELLSEHGFFRVHQSTIINLRHVTGYIKGDGGEVTMIDSSRVRVSRHRKEDFLKRFS